MLRLASVGSGLGLSLFFVAAADAQQATSKRVATTEPLPATAPAVSACAPAARSASASRFSRSFRRRESAAPTMRTRRSAPRSPAFYASRVYAPVWVTSIGFNAKAAAVIAEFGKADDWGLERRRFPGYPRRCRRPAMRRRRPRWPMPKSRYRLAALKYARYARGGRIMDPATQLSSYLDRKPPLARPEDVIEQIATASEPDAYLRGLHPSIPSSRSCGRSCSKCAMPLPRRRSVKLPQWSAARSRQERSAGRLAAQAAEGRSAGGDRQAGRRELLRRHSEGCRDGLPDARAARGPTASSATRRAPCSTTSRSSSPAKLLANMEEWRWMPEELGDFYVWVNIPEFTLRIVKNGEVIHTERVDHRQADKQTPVFSDEMEQIVFHPRWNVPDSIKVNELRPSLARGGTCSGARACACRARPRHRSRERRLELDRHPQLTRLSAAGRQQRARRLQVPLPQQARRLHARHHAKGLFEEASRAVQPRLHARARSATLAEMLLAEDKGWDAARIADLIANGPPNNEMPIDAQDRRAHHLLHRLGRRRRQAADRHATSTATSSASRRRSRAMRSQIAQRARSTSRRCARRERRYSGERGQRRRFHQPSARRLLTISVVICAGCQRR